VPNKLRDATRRGKLVKRLI